MKLDYENKARILTGISPVVLARAGETGAIFTIYSIRMIFRR